MHFVMFVPGVSVGLQKLNSKAWEQGALLEGLFDSPSYHSYFQGMLNTLMFSVQLNLGHTTAATHMGQ